MNEQRRGGSHKALLLLIPAAVIIAKGASRRPGDVGVRIRPRRVRRPRPWPPVPLRRPWWAIRRARRAPASAEDRVDAAELARTRPFGGRSRGVRRPSDVGSGFQHGGGRAGQRRRHERQAGGAVLSRTTSSVDSSTRVWAGSAPPAIATTISAAVVGHVHQRLADGRQRRPDPLGDRQVVEADDAQVLRDVEAHLARGLVDPEGLEVVAGEDRRRPVRQPEQRRALGRCPPRPGTCRS